MFSKEKQHEGQDGPNKIRYDKKQRYLQTITLNLINYAIKWKYSYMRWKNIVTKMILKSAGDNRIHRLRVIHLYEADFSLICGVFWRKIKHLICWYLKL